MNDIYLDPQAQLLYEIETEQEKNLQSETNAMPEQSDHAIFLVEQRYDIKTPGGTIQICNWLNTFSTQNRAISFCQSYVCDDEDIPPEWHFAIVRSLIDAPVPALGNRLVLSLDQRGNVLLDSQSQR